MLRNSIERRSSAGATHVGRGGAANVARRDESPETPEAAQTKAEGGDQKHHHGLAEKAKGFFKKA